MNEGDVQLVVFADDWGRHPSSAQHLIRHLLPEHQTLWVNTVGTRRPRWGDLGRIFPIIVNWFVPMRESAAPLPVNLRIIAPKMYPGFRNRWQRRVNARLISRAVSRALGSPADTRGAPGGRVALTTLPITADLVGWIPGVDRWVYYCVDDFSVWPGLDGGVMDAMEHELVAKVDAVVAVSETLVARMRSMGRRDVTLLTHGVDAGLFDTRQEPSAAAPSSGRAKWEAENEDRRTFAFWGLIDGRMDVSWVRQLAQQGRSGFATVFLAGPRQSPPPELFTDHHDVAWCGELPMDQLRSFAATHAVLVMPYIDAPVTRAMQPLKLKEYLATYKPVVVRDLPSTREWTDCCDVVSTAEDFVRVCLERAETGLPAEQRAARERRLPGESWSAKAAQLAAVLRAL